ncbi:MAG: hypothetical protein WDW38_000401 [Sanguina aurantia]
MDAEHAFYYTREVMVVLKREFATPDEEMKKIVLKVGESFGHSVVAVCFLDIRQQQLIMDGLWRWFDDILALSNDRRLIVLIGIPCSYGNSAIAWLAAWNAASREVVSMVSVPPVPLQPGTDLKDWSHIWMSGGLEVTPASDTVAGRALHRPRLSPFGRSTPAGAPLGTGGHTSRPYPRGRRGQGGGTLCRQLTGPWRSPPHDPHRGAPPSRRNYRQLVETTVELANKVGSAEIVGRVVEDMKDESEQYRRMVLETTDKVVSALGTADIDARLEELLVDGLLYAFQEQVTDDGNVILNGFGTVINSLGKRAKPYLPQICGIIKWRLNNKAAKTRQQAADLIARIAPVIKACDEEQLLGHLGVVLYEYLGEEYPEVLGSILGALKAIVNVIGMTKMTPPIKELLPRLTPVLKNRHEKVQENCIDLVGRIADRGHEFVPAREWMRICFELLDMLKAHKKAIRRATVNTFGYIAKAIGPQDVLATLLNNLKVQERQNRVCTTVAIAIVAETCAPYTVLPALMNEYRVPELNVQNGVLKALSFMFEYIGEMGKDYIYAVTPLLEDALQDRDLVHRQTAASVVQHMALGVAGLGCEDALVHLMNLIWPNIFETSPHVVNAVTGAIDGMRMSLGPTMVLNYLMQGLFHPARKVREVYWKLYNNLYIGAQDALVASFPRMEDEANNTYARHELDLLL